VDFFCTGDVQATSEVGFFCMCYVQIISYFCTCDVQATSEVGFFCMCYVQITS
jgi:hypothetical protein